MSPVWWVGFAAAAAAGAVLRFVIDAALARRATGLFPRGTLVVNLSGSLLLGLVTGVGSTRGAGMALFVVGTGFCGAFTTFSTFCYETVLLLQDGATGTALRNVAFNAGGCVAAAALGFAATT